MIRAVQASAQELERLIAADLNTDVSRLIDAGTGRDTTRAARTARPGTIFHDVGIAFSFDPSFHARALGIAAVMVADAALEAVAAAACR